MPLNLTILRIEIIRKVCRKKPNDPHQQHLRKAHHCGPVSGFIHPQTVTSVVGEHCPKAVTILSTNHSFIHLLIQYFLSTYCVPGTIAGAECQVNKASPLPSWAGPPGKGTLTRQTQKPRGRQQDTG